MKKKTEADLLSFLKNWKEKLNSQLWYNSPELYIEPNWISLVEEMSHFKLLCTEYTHFIQNSQNSTIHCHTGCSTCCHHSPESIEPLELFSIYGMIKNSDSFVATLEKAYFNIRQFDEKRKSIPKNLKGDDREEWLCIEYFKKQISCAFLKKKTCQIYEIRPLTCAFYNSHSDPRFCTPEYIQSSQNLSFLAELPESCEILWREINQPFDLYDLSCHLFSGILDVNTLESQWQFNPH